MAVLALTLALVVWMLGFLYLSMRAPSMQLAVPVRLLFAGTALSGFTFAMELLFDEFAWMMFWGVMHYIGLGLLLIGLGLLLLNYMGWVDGWDRRSLLLSSIVPLLILVLMASDPWHGIYYARIETGYLAGYSYLETERAWGFILTVGYIVFLCIAVLARIGMILLGAARSNLPHMAVMAMAIAISLVLSFLPNPIALIPIALLAMTTFSLMAPPIYLVTFKGGLSLQALSYRQVLDLSPDVKLIIDDDGQVIYSNQRAKDVLGDPPLIPDRVEWFLQKRGRGYSVEEVDVLTNGELKHYGFDALPLASRNGVYQGIMLSMRDITREVRIRKEVQLANEKLKLMSSISRHDMLNQLTVISGSVYLLEEILEDETAERMISSLQRAVDNMNRQLAFMRDYERLGAAEPQWISLPRAVEQAAESQELDGIELALEVDDVEVFADPMLVKVFSNLIHNTLLHGEDVGGIGISTEESGKRLRAIYRDDGGGIPAEYRDGLFGKGVGRNSGLGLFLSRNILELTGLSIWEQGGSGAGAEFVIEVPPEKWRRAGH